MPQSTVRTVLRLALGVLVCLAGSEVVCAQEAPPPAYLAIVEGVATLERDGETLPAVRDMPFVTGDRLRTEAGRVEIDFPDGTAIEVGSYSEVEALSPTRVRLLAGTMDHLQRRAVQTDSVTYLPQDLQRYGQTFDQYGSWNYDTSYGHVWYPRVAADWRPYYYGSWSPVPTYGWTWLGLDAWSWPTHHYGRWGYGRNAWFWIPGRTWSAAWVSWGLTTDYVSWCPLGFDGRPVFALSVGLGGRGWNGWTVMSRNHFGDRGYYAHNYSVDPRHFGARTGFVQTARLPLTLAHDRDRSRDRGDSREWAVERRERQVAVPRSTVVAPPAPVGVAVPRGTYRDYPRTANDPRRPATAEPRAPNVEPRTPNGFRRGMPTPAPRAYEPIVPPVAAPVVPPTIPTRGTPEYRPPMPEYRRPTPVYRAPAPESRPPANDFRAVPRLSAPAERPAQPERASAPAPSRTAPSDAPPAGAAQERPRGEGRPAESRRPR